MKQLLLPLLFFTLCFTSTAQSVLSDEFMVGTWQFTTTPYRATKVETEYIKQHLYEYQFYASGSFELRYYKVTKDYADTCLTVTKRGSWEIKKGNTLQLIYYKPEYQLVSIENKPKQLENVELFKGELAVFGLDSLVSYKFYNSEIFIRKATPIKVSSANNIGCLSPENFVTTPDTLIKNNYYYTKPYFQLPVYLINAADTQKVVRISNDGDIFFSTTFGQPDSIFPMQTVSGTCEIIEISNDSLTMGLSPMHIKYRDEEYDNVVNVYIDGGYNGMQVSYTAKLNDDLTLDYATPFQMNMQNAALTGMFVGGATALLVAPLVSVNFKTADFREQRYYRTVTYGLSAVVLSLGCYLAFQSDIYTIIPKGKDSGVDMWYLSY
jgi:hypothetical protein